MEPEVFLRPYSQQGPARINIVHNSWLSIEEPNEIPSMDAWFGSIPGGKVFGKIYKNVTIQTQVGFRSIWFQDIGEVAFLLFWILFPGFANMGLINNKLRFEYYWFALLKTF